VVSGRPVTDAVTCHELLLGVDSGSMIAALRTAGIGADLGRGYRRDVTQA
jgi:hypothetical protein